MGKKLAGAINVLLTAILAILAIAFPMKIATTLHESGGDLNVAGYVVLLLPIFALGETTALSLTLFISLTFYVRSYSLLPSFVRMHRHPDSKHLVDDLRS